MVKVSARIKEALEIRGMKQSELVKKTGIPKGSISQYISGHVEPKQDRIYLIAKALNVREAWLIGYDVPMDRTDNVEQNFSNSALEVIIEKAKNYDEDKLKMLLKLMNAMEEDK